MSYIGWYCLPQAALSRELALIQGPPGTGKTYVGIQVVKALLANTSGNAKSTDCDSSTSAGPRQAEEADEVAPTPHGPCIGPVLIVCFTNHALDQFLEGLLAAGLTDIVRVGGRYGYQAPLLLLHALPRAACKSCHYM